MKAFAQLSATLFALVAAAVFGSPNFASAHQPNGHQPNGHHYGNGRHISGAPGPIAGAGLPIIAVGFGVYWLIKRRRKAE
jgi:hypothetical protein